MGQTAVRVAIVPTNASANIQSLAAVTLQLGILMGDVAVVAAEQTSSEFPAALSEPPRARLDLGKNLRTMATPCQGFLQLIHLI
jgi:hypothetical protein